MICQGSPVAGACYRSQSCCCSVAALGSWSPDEPLHLPGSAPHQPGAGAPRLFSSIITSRIQPAALEWQETDRAVHNESGERLVSIFCSQFGFCFSSVWGTFVSHHTACPYRSLVLFPETFIPWQCHPWLCPLGTQNSQKRHFLRAFSLSRGSF